MIASKHPSDPLFTWRTPATPPVMTTDQDPNRKMVLELEEGYNCTGEYEHETGKFLAWRERLDENTVPPDPELVNESLEYVLEEADNVRFWMWVPRPSN